MEASKGLSNNSKWGVMMSELAQGRELAKQLQKHLDPSTPPETRNFLINKIILTYNNLLHHMPTNNSFPTSSQISFHGSQYNSPPSVSHCSSDPENHRRSSKRRKTMPKWVKTVKVEIEEGKERSLSDGYSWRKYGQKVILGATFPRGYYRCTHRNTRGCTATKQVQKSTEDSTLFHVIYKGHHTCSHSCPVTAPSTSPNPPPVPRGPKPEPEPTPPIVVQNQLKVETESLFFGTHPLQPAILETAGGSGSILTPDSDGNEQGGSGSDSTGLGLDEFTLDELIIDPNFAFDELFFY